MSYLPVTAHTQRMAAAPQPPGKASVWQASVKADWSQPEYNQRLEHHVDGSRPWARNIEALEHLVPESEREGVDKNGISRKLAWLAKQGLTVDTYDEIVAFQTRIKPPKPTRKERRKVTREELLIAHAEFEQELQRREKELPSKSRKRKGKKYEPLGPAMVMAPRGKYAKEKQPTPPPEPEVPFDASAWLDSYQQQQQFDPSFLPEAVLSSPVVPEMLGTGLNMYAHEVYSAAPGIDTYGTTGASPYSTTGSSEYGASSSSAYGPSSSSSYSAYSPSITGSGSTAQDQYAYSHSQSGYDQVFPDMNYGQQTDYSQPFPSEANYSQNFQNSSYYQQQGNLPTWGTRSYESQAVDPSLISPIQSTWSQRSDSTFPEHTYNQFLYR